MSCAVCGERAKVPDFDGETYFEIRRARYFGHPAALIIFRGAACVACYGVNACPMCGESLEKKAVKQ